MASGYSFENWLDWPLCEDNWPNQFDKGLFKEDSEWVQKEVKSTAEENDK